MIKRVILCLGVSHRDVDLAVNWLRWVAFLAARDGRDLPVLICCTQRVTEEQREALYVAAANDQCQPQMAVAKDEWEHGYPGAASHLFLRTLEAAAMLWPRHAVLWCEADTVPLRRSWFFEWAEAYQLCGKPFMGALVGTRFPHLSGNAIYPAEWRTLMPSLLTILDAPDFPGGRGQPWDVWCMKDTAPQMAETNLLFQIWKDRGYQATTLDRIPPAACLFHQDKTGALIREIAAKQYPEFLAMLPRTGPRFYRLRGHPSRLRARGIKIDFSYAKYVHHGWVCAVCDTELKDADANALSLLVGHQGLEEITCEQFCALTGRKPDAIPAERRRPKEAPVLNVSHPSVFVMLGRFGDICNVLPMLKAEADAGRRPTLVVSKDFVSIMDGVSYADTIVWDGPYDRLPDCLRWLRRDRGIHAPVVAQYHRNPYDKARLTDSYQREVWRLAGRLDQFASRGPLVFDQRDAGLEKIVVDQVRGTDPRPLVLVATESISSPFSQRTELFHAIERAVGAECHVVDLSQWKAGKIYHLLGLYDAAACLVTVDTVHLHLSRATKTPVIAIINDGWRGSVPPENAVVTIRYAELASDPGKAARAAHVVMRTREIDFPPCPVGPSTVVIREKSLVIAATNPFGQRFIHCTDSFGHDARHHVAHSTWNSHYADGVVPVHCHEYRRTARTELNDPRELPFLKDIIDAGAAKAESFSDLIVWTNSDIGLGLGVFAALHESTIEHGCTSMRRTESNGQPHMGRDLFAFRAGWWNDHRHEVPDYVIGAPYFDLGLVALIRRHCRIPAVSTKANMIDDLYPADTPPAGALHESHVSEWLRPRHQVLPSVLHNKRLFYEWAQRFAPEMKFSKGHNLQ